MPLYPKRTTLAVAGGLVPKGGWSGATTYATGDSVFYSGVSYISLQDSNTNHAPPNATWWQILAAQGDTGATGAQGLQGIQGEPGDATFSDDLLGSNFVVVTQGDQTLGVSGSYGWISARALTSEKWWIDMWGQALISGTGQAAQAIVLSFAPWIGDFGGSIKGGGGSSPFLGHATVKIAGGVEPYPFHLAKASSTSLHLVDTDGTLLGLSDQITTDDYIDFYASFMSWID